MHLPASSKSIAVAATLLASTSVYSQCLPMYEFVIVEDPACGGSTTVGWDISDSLLVGRAYPCGGTPDAFEYQVESGVYELLPFPAGTTSSDAVACTDDGAIAGSANNVNFNPEFSAFLRDGDQFTVLGIPGPGCHSETHGMGIQRWVVGEWGDYVNGPAPKAFLWDGKIHDFNATLGSFKSEAYDVSDTGLVTGWKGTANNVDARAFVYNHHTGDILTIPMLPGAYSMEGRAINNAGQVCGLVWYPDKGTPQWRRRGFYWDGSEVIDIGLTPDPFYDEVFPEAISDDGTIVGFLDHGAGGYWRTFVWKAGMADLLDRRIVDRPSSLRMGGAHGINSQGQIATNGSIDPDPHRVTFILTPISLRVGDFNCDQIVNIDDLLGVINNWGQCPPLGERCAGDLNYDRVVNVDDLLLVINDWGAGK